MFFFENGERKLYYIFDNKFFIQPQLLITPCPIGFFNLRTLLLALASTQNKNSLLSQSTIPLEYFGYTTQTGKIALRPTSPLSPALQ